MVSVHDVINEILSRDLDYIVESSWCKVNYLGLALGMALNPNVSVAKGLKLKVTKCWGLIRTFVEVMGEKNGRGAFLLLYPIRNSVNPKLKAQKYIYICTTWKFKNVNLNSQ